MKVVPEKHGVSVDGLNRLRMPFKALIYASICVQLAVAQQNSVSLRIMCVDWQDVQRNCISIRGNIMAMCWYLVHNRLRDEVNCEEFAVGRLLRLVVTGPAACPREGV